MKRATLAGILAVVTGLGYVQMACAQGQEQPVTQDQINRAVEAGVKYLKGVQGAGGSWPYGKNDPEKDVGCTALVGLALLEAGVPPNDQQVSRAAQHVRGAASWINEVYSVSLAIMFLDRFGGVNESQTIQFLGRKLALGMVDGGWSYKCGGGQGNSPNTPGLVGIGQSGPAPAAGVIPDNSNTQFAILALWIARKHRVPVDGGLRAAEQRFRHSQRGDGGWGYGTTPFIADKSTPAMTCAGLLGLFLGFGAAKEREATLRASGKAPADPPADKPNAPVPPKTIQDLAEDPAVKAALRYLTIYVGNDSATIPEKMYFLWSLERLCVAYQLKTVGEVDWYSWGSGHLIRGQGNDGSWSIKYGGAVDTSFALLFLRKVDLVGTIRSTEIRAGRDRETTIREGSKPPAGTSASPPGSGKPDAPAATGGDDGARLASNLMKASGSRRDELIAEYQKAKGVDYTLALAAAIPNLSGQTQEKARMALATRMQRLTARSLKEYLADGDREIRRAAAFACRVKPGRELVPDLIALLRDPSEPVVVAAHDSLKELTGQSLERSHAAWDAWWKKNKN